MIRVTVDLVIFTIQDHRLRVLLIRRKIPPFRGQWALPGGFVREGESLEDAAKRELAEEAGVRNIYLEQLYSFGDPGRDPRAQVVTIAYYALIASDRITLRATTDAADARWFDMAELPRLAFDHRKILDYALFRLRNKLEYTTVGFQLLPKKFTLTDLQRMYESILGRKLDKRNFRRKIAQLDILKPLSERRRQGVARPARLYQFKEQ
jgi:8-oxo-dGTP diphosphatase